MADSQIQVKLNPDVTPAGSDLSVVNAARKSFNTRSEWDYPTEEITDFDVSDGYTVYEVKDYKNPGLKPKDKRLLEFLARGMSADDFEGFIEEFSKDFWDMVHDTKGGRENFFGSLWEWRNTPTHDTPFNHTFISFEVKAPLFVARQLVKHEYLIWSEASGRYIENMEFYRPDVWRGQPENKKQGSTGKATSQYHPNLYCQDVEDLYVEKFRKMVDTQNVCMEQARMLAPNTLIVEWTWSGTLGAFAKMCQLRLHPEAQYESQLVARQVYQFLREYYPIGAKALVEGPDV